MPLGSKKGDAVALKGSAVSQLKLIPASFVWPVRQRGQNGTEMIRTRDLAEQRVKAFLPCWLGEDLPCQVPHFKKTPIEGKPISLVGNRQDPVRGNLNLT